MAQVKSNVVDTIAVKAGMSLANTSSYNGNAGSIAIHADKAMANAEQIGNIADQIAQQQDNSGPSMGPAAGPQAGGSLMRTALTAGALAVGMAFVPGVAAVAAVAASIGEAAHFGLKGNAGKGEMTLANVDVATAFEKGVYVSAYDGQSSDVSTGKPVASLAAMGQAGPPAKGMQNFGAIVSESTAGVDKDKIREDVLARFKEQKDDFGADMRRLREMGAINKNDPNAVALEERMAEIGDGIKAALPRPKAFTGGMVGGPGGMGGMG